jgi:hypothetical protein
MATEIRHTGLIIPEGCRWCGIPYREHAQNWVKSKGWHGWEAPTKKQVRARIQAKYGVEIRDED